jgi:quercetin dioxygenase-like cupin family protein
MTDERDVIVNPAMGARIEFRARSRDTQGSFVEFDFFLRAGGVVATDHLHPQQEERFEVISGLMAGHVGGRMQTLGPGGSSVAPAGVAHAWRNAGDDEAHLRVRFSPALHVEDLFAVVFALGAEGRADERGVPVLPLRLVMLAAFPDELRPAAMPPPVHRLIVRALAPLGRQLRGRYARRGFSTTDETGLVSACLRRRHRTSMDAPSRMTQLSARRLDEHAPPRDVGSDWR